MQKLDTPSFANTHVAPMYVRYYMQLRLCLAEILFGNE